MACDDSGLVVLLVEDEWIVRAAIAAELSDAGCCVVEADTAEAAIEVLRSGETIDALITDIQLSGEQDGWDVGETAMKCFRESRSSMFGEPIRSSPARLGQYVFRQTLRSVPARESVPKAIEIR